MSPTLLPSWGTVLSVSNTWHCWWWRATRDVLLESTAVPWLISPCLLIHLDVKSCVSRCPAKTEPHQLPCRLWNGEPWARCSVIAKKRNEFTAHLPPSSLPEWHCLSRLTAANRTGRPVYHLSGTRDGVNEIRSRSCASAPSFLSIKHLQVASQRLLTDKRQEGSLLWEGVMLKSTPPSWWITPFAKKKNRTMWQRLHGQKEKLGIAELTNLTHLGSHQSLLRLFTSMACYINNECLLNQASYEEPAKLRWEKGSWGNEDGFGVVVPCNSCFWISEGDYRTGAGRWWKLPNELTSSAASYRLMTS